MYDNRNKGIIKMRKLRNNKIMIGMIGLVLLMLLSIFTYFFFNPLRLETDHLVIEYKKEFDPIDNIKSVFLGNKEDVQFEGSVDINKLGKYNGTYKYKEVSIPVEIEVKDLVAPVLEVREYATDMVEMIVPELFVAKVEDETQVQLMIKEKIEDREGRQDIVVVAKDESGNITEKSTALNRRKDTESPKAEINDRLSFKLGTDYDLNKYITYKDDLDPAPVLEIDTNDVDFNKDGKYVIHYIVKDRSGNKTVIDKELEILPNEELYQNIVYLTFDDGPSNNTSKIVDILNKYKIKATFFVTGNGQKYNDNIAKAYKSGHSIGLHTYSHDYASVYSSMDAYFQDLEKINDLVERIVGQRSNILRFPGGSSNTISANYTSGIMSKLVKAVREKGYQFFDWNTDSTDASGNNVAVEKLIENATSSQGQYINILFHDTDAKDTTVEALPKIIEYYQQKGYIFKGLNVDSYAPHHHVNN